MMLSTKHRQLAMTQPFAGAIVQAHMSDLDIGFRQAVYVHTKSVVLIGDIHVLGEQTFHRVIAATMTCFQLEGAATKCATEDLVPQTDAEDRYLSQQLSRRVDQVIQHFGITRTVGKDHPSAFQAKICAAVESAGTVMTSQWC